MPTDYKQRHETAMRETSVASTARDAHEAATVAMVKAWQAYAAAHAARFESKIGQDYVLGPEWAAIGQALIGLLNGETGRLDCGTLDGAIRAALTANECDDEK